MLLIECITLVGWWQSFRCLDRGAVLLLLFLLVYFMFFLLCSLTSYDDVFLPWREQFLENQKDLDNSGGSWSQYPHRYLYDQRLPNLPIFSRYWRGVEPFKETNPAYSCTPPHKCMMSEKFLWDWPQNFGAAVWIPELCFCQRYSSLFDLRLLQMLIEEIDSSSN